MSTRQLRFEVVRTTAGWHARFRAANGQVVWTTEVYTRRRAAEGAILSMTRPLSPLVVVGRINGRMTSVVCAGDRPSQDRRIQVRELDER